MWRSAVAHHRAAGHEVRVLTTDWREPYVDASTPEDDDVHRELRWYWHDHDFPRMGPRARLALERHNASDARPPHRASSSRRRVLVGDGRHVALADRARAPGGPSRRSPWWWTTGCCTGRRWTPGGGCWGGARRAARGRPAGGSSQARPCSSGRRSPASIRPSRRSPTPGSTWVSSGPPRRPARRGRGGFSTAGGSTSARGSTSRSRRSPTCPPEARAAHRGRRRRQRTSRSCGL